MGEILVPWRLESPVKSHGSSRAVGMDVQRMGLNGTPSCILPSLGAIASSFMSPYTHLLKCPCHYLLISATPFDLLMCQHAPGHTRRPTTRSPACGIRLGPRCHPPLSRAA